MSAITVRVKELTAAPIWATSYLHLLGGISATKQEYVMIQGRIDACKGIRTI